MMTKLQAKRAACTQVSLLIRATLEGGWTAPGDLYPDTADEDKFLAAIEDVMRDLARKGIATRKCRMCRGSGVCHSAQCPQCGGSGMTNHDTNPNQGPTL